MNVKREPSPFHMTPVHGKDKMEKDVFVRVKGSFTGPADGEDIELIAPGQYFLRNGAQYILYDEMDEALGQPIKNTIKITPDKVSLRKRGPVVADMSFESGEERMATYTTPFGSLVLNVLAKNMEIRQTEDELNIKLDYELEIEYEHTSDCVIDIAVKSKSTGMFPLS